MVDGEDNWDEHWADFSGAASDNPAQHFRHRLLSKLVRGKNPNTLIDIGSGQGDLLELLSHDAPNVRLAGVELSHVGVEQTLQKVPRANVFQVDLLEADTSQRLRDIRADAATCCEVLEHLDDPSSFLQAARDALAPGATIFVTVPGGPRSEFDRVIGHRRHYSPVELRQLLEQSGFKVSTAYGAGFPFFNLYRLVVIARGEKVVTDVGSQGMGRLAAVVMKVFGILLRFNVPRSRWGWQTVAVATVEPGAGATS
jgi:2-polyprenyl-3-methyl-5-hydroxy-6-metoxy-1,4-benzoquinol methylase